LPQYGLEQKIPFLSMLNGTVLFMTSNGRFAVSRRDGVRRGDQVVLISGLDHPFIMRQAQAKYLLISPAIVPGLMQGELCPDDQKSLELLDII
jgi:hypothetical protein